MSEAVFPNLFPTADWWGGVVCSQGGGTRSRACVRCAHGGSLTRMCTARLRRTEYTSAHAHVVLSWGTHAHVHGALAGVECICAYVCDGARGRALIRG